MTLINGVLMFEYEYPHPALTVDSVVFGLDNEELKILLIKRKLEPFKGTWALPGGFVQMDENLDDAAKRELLEETGVKQLYLEQLATFGNPDRDPRERVITVAYFAIVNLFDHSVKADTDAEEVGWFPVEDPPELAFDHDVILATALNRLQGKIRYQALVFEFLPDKFTLSQLQKLYEKILCHPLDKRNFRKKIQGTGLVIPLDEYEMDVSHRAARFYYFDRDTWEEKSGEGFRFSI
ncbi:MAG: NUDIX hydrolase [Spirochaetaceae bacterium]|nr:NUDIX hydrolase [Spirochaetaceae bacterium]